MLAATFMITREDSVWILVPGLVPHLPVKYIVSNVGCYLKDNKRRQCLDTGSWSLPLLSTAMYPIAGSRRKNLYK